MLKIQQAEPDQFDTVLELLSGSVEWLRSKGLDQWSTWENWRKKMRPALNRGDVWLLFDDGALVGTITVETVGDPDFWTSEELADGAAYVSKLAVRRDRKGAELGRVLLDWASDHAYRYGCDWLRLDAWKSNDRLHSYYADRGWTYLRTVERPERQSGTLFQIPTAPQNASIRGKLTEVPTIPVVQSTLRKPSQSPDPAGNWQPAHMHHCRDFLMDYPYGEPQPLMVIPGYRYQLRRVRDEWLIFNGLPGRKDQKAGRLSSSAVALEADARYVLTHVDGAECGVQMATFRDGGPLATP